MSTLKVNNIVSADGSVNPTFNRGLSVQSNTTITTNNLNVTGVMTCGYLVGDGSALTNLDVLTFGKVLSINLLR